MILKTIARYQRTIILAMLPFVLLFVLEIPATAQDTSPAPYVSNIKWSAKGDIITVTYDLNGSADATYNIITVMKRENDPLFRAVPAAAEGDLGEGISAGVSREFRWYYRRDFPQGFIGEGYYFEVEVKQLPTSHTWMYYAIGGAALTIGIVALIASRHQNSTRPVIELPYPPPRP